MKMICCLDELRPEISKQEQIYYLDILFKKETYYKHFLELVRGCK